MDKERSLVTKQEIGELAVAGRLSIDLHAEFMVSRTYGKETVLNWFSCGYSGGGRASQVGGGFGDFGFQVPYAERETRYPHAATVDRVPAVRFDGNDFLKATFAVETKLAGDAALAIEAWFRCSEPGGTTLAGWQSPDGRRTSAAIVLPAGAASKPGWRHLVVNCTPSGEERYLDGERVFRGPRATRIANGHVLILGGASSLDPSFRGDLAALRVHDQTMTSEEIAHNFQGGPMLGTEMHSWWRMEPDQWWSQESEHFRHCVDKEEMRGWSEKERQEFDSRIPGMFALAELIYRTYSERLAIRSSVVSVLPEERGDGIKYKVPIQPAGGSFMGWDGHFGWACQGAGFINPHELVHGWDAMTGNLAGNYWEAHANWPQTYNGIYQTVPVIIAESSAFPASGRTYYHDRLMFEHLAQTPEYGPMFIAKLWFDGPTQEDKSPYPWIAFDRVNPYPGRTLANEFGKMAMRNVAYDYTTFVEAPAGKGNTPYGNDGVVDPENRYRKTADLSKADIERSGRVRLERVPYEAGWWRVPKEQAPQQFGWNVCPLRATSGNATATLKGYVDPARGSDWRAGFVGIDASGKPVYGKLFKPGEKGAFESADRVRELYLVVIATPKRVMPIDMVGDFRSFEQAQFPYRVQLGGCTPLEASLQPTERPAGAKHPNGGGFVASTAQADATAYVGPKALVLGASKVLGTARIEDRAVVQDATVKDRAVVSGHALVKENSVVAGGAKVRGYAVVKGGTTVTGNAKVLEHAAVFTQKTCSGDVVAKGMAAVYGGNQSGTAMLDGFYAKGNEIAKGKWFTWSWGQGKNPGEVDEDFGGLYADYEFDEAHPWMAKDSFGATWGYLAGGASVRLDPGRSTTHSTLMAPEKVLASLEPPENVADKYGQRIAGYLTAPGTGDYTFWIAADDEGEFWIGGAGAAKADRRLCWTSEWVGAREWGRRPSQKSAPVRLAKGRAYPILLLHAEDVGGDHVSVAWTTPGASQPEPIPGSVLSVDPAGKRKGVLQRAWSGASKVSDLARQPGYPEGRVRVPSGALSLNGKDQSVELPVDIADMRDCSYTASFRWDGKDGGARVFEFSGPGGSAWLSPSEGGRLTFAIRSGQEVRRVTAPAVRKGAWTTVRVILSGGAAKLYVDGKLAGSKPSFGWTPDRTRATLCTLGRGRTGGFFGGSIARFTVHSVALVKG